MKQLTLSAVVAAALALSGCWNVPGDRVLDKEGEPTNIKVWYDEERGVYCWIYKAGTAGGISCLPESEVR